MTHFHAVRLTALNPLSAPPMSTTQDESTRADGFANVRFTHTHTCSFICRLLILQFHRALRCTTSIHSPKLPNCNAPWTRANIPTQTVVYCPSKGSAQLPHSHIKHLRWSMLSTKLAQDTTSNLTQDEAGSIIIVANWVPSPHPSRMLEGSTQNQ